MANWQDFKHGVHWENGSVQEVIADPDENLEDVVFFMNKYLEGFDRNDLFFWKQEIEQDGNKFYIKLRSRSILTHISESEIVKTWSDGTRYEVYGEDLQDIIENMRLTLTKFNKDNLFFWVHEIKQEEDKFQILLRDRNNPETQSQLKVSKSWVDGSTVEVIPEPGDTADDVATFMRQALEEFNRRDLFFWKHEIKQEEEKCVVKLRARSLPTGPQTRLFSR